MKFTTDDDDGNTNLDWEKILLTILATGMGILFASLIIITLISTIYTARVYERQTGIHLTYLETLFTQPKIDSAMITPCESPYFHSKEYNKNNNEDRLKEDGYQEK